MSSELPPDGNDSTSLGSQIVSGFYKYEGWKYKLSGILGIVFGATLIFVGIVIVVAAPHVYKLGLFAGVVGIILILVGLFYKKRAKTLSKGRLL